MPYADATFYSNTFKGSMIPEDELEKQLNLASMDIDSLTYNRIGGETGLAMLTPFQKAMVEQAVCLHAEYMYEYGSFLDSPLGGYSAGSTSVSLKNTGIAGQNGVNTSRRVFNILRQTGLTVRLFL